MTAPTMKAKRIKSRLYTVTITHTIGRIPFAWSVDVYAPSESAALEYVERLRRERRLAETIR